MAEGESNRETVGRLFGRFTGDLVRFLGRRVRNPADARDLAQETYVRLLRVSQLDLIRDPQSYLFRIAANLAHEHQFKLRRERLHFDEPDVLADVGLLSGVSMEEKADLAIRREQLEKVLAMLAPRHRAALVLHRQEGMTYEEIAVELGVTIHAVKKYIAVGLRHCRAHLVAEESR